MMSQYRFINCKKCTSIGGGCASVVAGSLWELSGVSTQFCYEPKNCSKICLKNSLCCHHCLHPAANPISFFHAQFVFLFWTLSTYFHLTNLYLCVYIFFYYCIFFLEYKLHDSTDLCLVFIAVGQCLTHSKCPINIIE